MDAPPGSGLHALSVLCDPPAFRGRLPHAGVPRDLNQVTERWLGDGKSRGNGTLGRDGKPRRSVPTLRLLSISPGKFLIRRLGFSMRRLGLPKRIVGDPEPTLGGRNLSLATLKRRVWGPKVEAWAPPPSLDRHREACSHCVLLTK